MTMVVVPPLISRNFDDPTESKFSQVCYYNAYVGIHIQVRILVFDNYQRCPVSLMCSSTNMISDTVIFSSVHALKGVTTIKPQLITRFTVLHFRQLSICPIIQILKTWTPLVIVKLQYSHFVYPNICIQ